MNEMFAIIGYLLFFFRETSNTIIVSFGDVNYDRK